MTQQKRIWLESMRTQVWSLASLSGLMIQHCHELWCCRHGSNHELLWLWCRLAAIAIIRPLTWEPPYSTGEALKWLKKEKRVKMMNFMLCKCTSMKKLTFVWIHTYNLSCSFDLCVCVWLTSYYYHTVLITVIL